MKNSELQVATKNNALIKLGQNAANMYSHPNELLIYLNVYICDWSVSQLAKAYKFNYKKTANDYKHYTLIPR